MKIYKKACLIFGLVLIGTELKAQRLDLELGGGTGLVYIIEGNDNGINIDYSLPIGMYAGLKWSPKNSNFGVKIRFQYLNTQVIGTNWKNGSPMDGDVTTFTGYVLLEYLWPVCKKIEFGGNIGIGYTDETLHPNKSNFSLAYKNGYSNFAIGLVTAFHLSSHVAFRLEPSLYWNDPINSIRYFGRASRWSIAGEDLNVVLQFGLSYRLM